MPTQKLRSRLSAPLFAFVTLTALTFTLVGCDNVAIADNTDTPDKSYGSVNGSVHVGAESEVRDVDTVNGSIHIDRGARVGEVEAVNGSIKIEDDVELRELESVNGATTLGRNVRVAQSLSTVNGTMKVGEGSEVGGSVETVNGSISLHGVTVHGDVETYNGHVQLSDGTSVAGDVRIKKSKMSWGKQSKPKVVIGRNTVIHGAIEAERPVYLWVHESATVGEIRGAEAQRFSGDSPPS